MSGEVVFNTSLTGYQEISTDPSYAGRSSFSPILKLAITAPTRQITKRREPYIEGLVMREFSPISSNWRSQQVADEYLERYSVPVIAEIDTRALVRTCAPMA